MRKSGILLPISSIPSKYGIGAFSKQAYQFVDFLEKAGQTLWQILPLGPTGYGDYPYQSFSTYAGNPYFIDLETLVKEGLLRKSDCAKCDFGDNERYIDYEKVYNARFDILRKAYENSNLQEDGEFEKFIRENSYWLDDYALFMAIKNARSGKSFLEWEDDLKLRKYEALEAAKQEYADEVLFYKFQQYQFAKQWKSLKNYANEKGIKIIGDIPIYVALDSADVWSNPQLFQLDENLNPIGVAGCPPDAFSETGQLWGNPLYKWDYHRETGYDWWVKRVAYCYELYDMVRIDHFRGFDEYYYIPYGDQTAEFGHWEPGPRYDLFRTIKERLGEKEIIAEDLGLLTDSVMELLKECGYPGMKILQFAFGSDETNDYLTHNYNNNCVVYTGTHDNDTILGWYKTASKEEKAYANKYLNITSKEDVQWEFIRMALASVADFAIIPMQDYLGLGSEARINIPSTLGLNWKWRLDLKDCDRKLADRIKKMCKLYGRVEAELKEAE